MGAKMWIEWLNAYFLAFLFTYIFVKGYEGRGIMEVVRFGILAAAIYKPKPAAA